MLFVIWALQSLVKMEGCLLKNERLKKKSKKSCILQNFEEQAETIQGDPFYISRAGGQFFI